jgi:signal transduction histidine kinase
LVAGISVEYPLDQNYLIFRKIQTILLIYIVINTVILAYIGVYRISRLVLRPLQRLSKRVDEYRDDSGMLLFDDKWDNEFNKLSKSINSMLARIAEDKDKLSLTVRSLEKSNRQLQQAQNDIVRAEKLASVGRLSAGIAHEIGNPIGIVIGYVELLKQGDISESERLEFLHRIENETARIDVIIKQLLDFSRITDTQNEQVSIHQLIEETVAIIRFQPAVNHIDFTFVFNAKDDIVMADAAKLRQVFLNLILNAVDAISSKKAQTGKKIEISTQLADQPAKKEPGGQPMIQIMFTDNGVGIPEKSIDKIFDPFYTTKSPGKGTGLGLSVSFRIIEGLNGKIEAVSEPEIGTTMSIFLPLAAQEPKKSD